MRTINNADAVNGSTNLIRNIRITNTEHLKPYDLFFNLFKYNS